MTLTIQQPKACYLDVKRLRLKGCLITSTCPECGKTVTRDLATHYLSYPGVAVPEKMTFQHEDEDVLHEWYEQVVMEITFRSATKAELEKPGEE